MHRSIGVVAFFLSFFSPLFFPFGFGLVFGWVRGRTRSHKVRAGGGGKGGIITIRYCRCLTVSLGYNDGRRVKKEKEEGSR